MSLRQARKQREQRFAVARLVEDVGREDEVQRARARAAAPARSSCRRASRSDRVVALRVGLRHRDRLRRPVGGEHAAAGERGGDARQPEAAAELERPRSLQRPAADRPRQRERARPQLGPVREELLLLERVLVEQRLGIARPQQPQVAAVERDDLLDEVVHGPWMYLLIADRSRESQASTWRAAPACRSRPSRWCCPASPRVASPPAPRRPCARRPRSSATGSTWPRGRCAPAPRGRSGMVVTDVTHPFFGPVLRGAQAAAWRAGYAVMLVDVADDPDRERASFEALRAGPADGYMFFDGRPARARRASRRSRSRSPRPGCRSSASTPSAAPTSRSTT